jgi:hypothetical protein
MTNRIKIRCNAHDAARHCRYGHGEIGAAPGNRGELHVRRALLLFDGGRA